MIFENPKTHSILLDPARHPDVKEEIIEHYKELGIDVSKATSLKSVHFRVIMEYKEVKGDAKLSTKNVSLRAIEYSGDQPLALHELSIDPDKPKLLSTNLSQDVLANFQEVVDRIEKKENGKPTGKLRHLSVPALNVEAIWYRDAKGWNDIYFKDFGSDEMLVISENDFVKFVNDLKIAYLKGREKFKNKKGGAGRRGG
jgi:hypothetical protein